MELRIVRNKVLAVNLLILGSVLGVCSGVGFLVAFDMGSIFSFIAAATALIIGVLTITENERLVWLAMLAAYAYEALCLPHSLVFLGLLIGACNPSLFLTTEKGGCGSSKEYTGIYAFNMALCLANGVLCAMLILNVCGCFTKQTEKARPMYKPKSTQTSQPRSEQKTPSVPTATSVPGPTHSSVPVHTPTRVPVHTPSSLPFPTAGSVSGTTASSFPIHTPTNVPVPSATSVPKKKRRKPSYNWPSTPILRPYSGH